MIEATGRALPDWHREGLPPLLPPGSFSALFLAPEREALYARIDARFDEMLDGGAIPEVLALAARQLDPLLPAMKAHGVPVLMRLIRGEVTREAAAEFGRDRDPAIRQTAVHLVQAPAARVRMGGPGGGEGVARRAGDMTPHPSCPSCPGSSRLNLLLTTETWTAGTPGAKARFALLPGHDAVRDRP